MFHLYSVSKSKFTGNRKYVAFRFVSEIFVKGASFFILFLISKYLGVVSFGVNAQITTIVSFFVPIATLGLGFSLVRLLAGESDKNFRSRRFLSSLILVTLTSLIFLIFIFAFAPVLNSLFFKVDQAVPVIRGASILVLITAIDSLLNDYFRARMLFGQYSAAQITQSFALVLLISGSIYLGYGLLEVVLVTVSVGVIKNFLMVVYVFTRDVDLRAGLLPALDSLMMVRFGFPIVLTGMSSWIMSVGDRTLIGYFTNIGQVGVYSAAYTLSGILVVLGAPFWAPLYPVLSSAKRNATLSEVNLATTKYMSAFCIVAVPALIGMTLLSSELLQLFGSKEFVMHPLVFGMIAFSLFSDQFTTSAHYLIYLENRPMFLLRLLTCSGCSNLILNVVLLPRYGIAGAAFSTLLVYLSTCGFLFKEVVKFGYKLSDLYDFLVLSRVVAASILMAVVVFSVRLWLPAGLSGLMLACAVGVLSYSFFIFLFLKSRKKI